MFSLTERLAGRDAAIYRNGGTSRLDWRRIGLGAAIRISIVAVAAGTTMAVAGGPDTESRNDAAATAVVPQQPVRPTLAIAPVLDVAAAAESRLSLGVIGRTEDLPLGTYIRIQGLPTSVTLSGGQTNAKRAWIVSLWALEDLKIKVPPGVSGDHILVVALVDSDGDVLGERTVKLRIKPAAATAQSAPEVADTGSVKEAAVTTTPPLQHPPPELIVGPVVDVAAAAVTTFSIRIGSRPEDLPLGAYVRIQGLPTSVTLSGGQTNADRAWVVPLWALEDLKIKVPAGVSGNLDLGVALVDNNGAVLAERSATLSIKPRVAAVPSADRVAPAQRKQAVIPPVLSRAGAVTTTRGKQPIRRTALRSTVSVIRPRPIHQGEPVRTARDVPYQSRCFSDDRAPCNIGGGNRWWLWRALGHIAGRGSIPAGVRGKPDLSRTSRNRRD